MLKYLVIDIVSGKSRIFDTPDHAAQIAQLKLEELELEFDQCGVCETDQYTIVEILA